MLRYLMISFIFLIFACQSVDLQEVVPPSDALVKRLDLNGFYKKHLDVKGLPVIGSDKVNDYAFREAAYLINVMLEGREDIRQKLIENKVRYVIYGINEFTTDIPEHKHLENHKKGKDWWDKRARGLGAQIHCPATSCGEENLLCYKGDPYKQENILIHEFAHTIHACGLDKAFDKKLKKTYDAAMKKGLWKTKYAAVNHHEYWAEGVQSWFNNNREDDHDHNHVNTRQELKDYDSALAALCEEVFGKREWTYTKPLTRLHQSHLKGYEPSKAPEFKWPARLKKIDKASLRAK